MATGRDEYLKTIQDAMAAGSHQGTYGEGQISAANAQMAQLKQAVQQGKLSLTDYQEISQGVVQKTMTAISALRGGGSKSGKAAEAAGAQQFLDTFAKPDVSSGQWVAKLPFTKQEYSRLPDAVLPTQSDVSNGLWDNTVAPMQRFRSETPANSANGGTASGPTPTDTKGLPSAPNTVTSPSGGLNQDVGTREGVDQNKILAEAELQKQLAGQSATDIAGQRSDQLGKLAELLTKQAKTSYERSLPDLYENLNTRGLLRSSNLGTEMAKKEQQSFEDVGNQVALQGLKNQGDLTTSLSGIEGTYLGARNSALQRTFSLQDYDRQVQAAKELGLNVTPVAPTGSGKGAGALSGAASGATAGTAVSPGWGTAIGAVTGGVVGGQLGGKK